jgi:hypothetical protein
MRIMGASKQGRPAGSRIDTSGAMPVPLTGSTALVPMSRLWRPMARTDRNRERRAPGTPAPTCSPTICRGVAPTNTDHPLGFSLGGGRLARPAADPVPSNRVRARRARTSSGSDTDSSSRPVTSARHSRQSPPSDIPARRWKDILLRLYRGPNSYQQGGGR